MVNRYSRYITVSLSGVTNLYYQWADLDDSYKQVSMQNPTKHITYNDSHWLGVL